MSNSTSKMLARMSGGSKLTDAVDTTQEEIDESINLSKSNPSPEMDFLLNNILGLTQSKTNTPMD